MQLNGTDEFFDDVIWGPIGRAFRTEERAVIPMEDLTLCGVKRAVERRLEWGRFGPTRWSVTCNSHL